MATAKSLTGLMKWLSRDEWQGAFTELMDLHVGRARANADLSVEGLTDLLGDNQISVLWGCVFEDFLARDLDGGRNIVDDYLKRRGWKESATNKRYITALRTSVMSLYEISDIVRDESFVARDLIRGGEPVRVAERSGTRYLKPWDWMAARIVQMGPRNEMAGGVLTFDLDTGQELLATLRHAGKKQRTNTRKLVDKGEHGAGRQPVTQAVLDTETLRGLAFVFTNFWLENLVQMTLHPTLPQLRNTDGDEYVITTISYPLQSAASIETIGLALSTIPALRQESESFWNWIEPRGRASRKKVTGVGQTLITTLDDGSTVLGTIEVKDRLLVVGTNSWPRAEKARALIEPVLGRLVGDPHVEAQTVAQLMASRPADSSTVPPSACRLMKNARLSTPAWTATTRACSTSRCRRSATSRRAGRPRRRKDVKSWCSGSSSWKIKRPISRPAA